MLTEDKEANPAPPTLAAPALAAVAVAEAVAEAEVAATLAAVLAVLAVAVAALLAALAAELTLPAASAACFLIVSFVLLSASCMLSPATDGGG
jgi:hypothetical protein